MASTSASTVSSAARNRPLGGRLGEQAAQGGHDGLGLGPVGDVLAREGLLVHRRAHVAGIEPVDPHVGLLGGEHVATLLERRLRRAVAAPALVALDGGVGRDVDDRAAEARSSGSAAAPGRAGRRRSPRRRRRARRAGSSAERRLGRRPEHAGVVDEQVEPAAARRRRRRGRPGVAGRRRHRRSPAPGRPAAAASAPATAPPALASPRASITTAQPVVDQRPGQRPAEASRCSGDQCCPHRRHPLVRFRLMDTLASDRLRNIPSRDAVT